MKFLKLTLLCAFSVWASFSVHAQKVNWNKAGNGYYQNIGGEIVEITLPKSDRKTVISRALLTTTNGNTLRVRSFQLSEDGTKALIFTNTKKVWRADTKGDYWVADLTTNTLSQVGKNQPTSSLMFAKFSPDGRQVAYVSGHNIYVEDVNGGNTKALTKDGTTKLINGTFDWAYEEEFGCQDGFRWSPDSKSIAFWQIDATKIRSFLMLNTTDSIYSFNVPVEYPKVGEDPSSCKIGVINVATASINWLNVPGSAVQNYIPRMEWVPNTNNIVLQQIDRTQTKSIFYLSDPTANKISPIYKEEDMVWIDAIDKFVWIKNNKEFILKTEKDGWAHLYSVALDGKKTTLITNGNYDVIDVNLVDETSNYVYFTASPSNATQKYLFKTKLDGKGKLEQVTPSVMLGTHNYSISPNALFAQHSYQSALIKPVTEWMNFKTGNPLTMNGSITNQLASQQLPKNKVEFFKVTTSDGITMDGWMKKPDNFDRTKKYPVVFYVYGEPASATALDTYGAGVNWLYNGDMAKDGYIYISMDNRGAPVPKGKAWRKDIYKNIGTLNIRDQALAAKQLLAANTFMDKDRVAVWGWSGGGSSTLNLLFQYPDVFKTGISIAPVANQLTYDNIYQERYMGTPFPTTAAYTAGSPVTYAKNLTGNLLLIHGTGDDNVHYQNAEMLINELVKHKKTFQLMSYPNRTHSISEGAGTSEHLSLTFTKFLKENCPPGGR